MRPLDKVIDATLKLVPNDFSKKNELTVILESIKQSYLFAAPEMHSAWWFQFSKALNSTFGEPDTDWKNEIVVLVSGTKNYQEILDA
jgi:hypothetical protein